MVLWTLYSILNSNSKGGTFLIQHPSPIYQYTTQTNQCPVHRSLFSSSIIIQSRCTEPALSIAFKPTLQRIHPGRRALSLCFAGPPVSLLGCQSIRRPLGRRVPVGSGGDLPVSDHNHALLPYQYYPSKAKGSSFIPSTGGRHNSSEVRPPGLHCLAQRTKHGLADHVSRCEVRGDREDWVLRVDRRILGML